jgi:transcription elongation factor GreA
MIADLNVRLNQELDRLAEELTVRIPARLGSEQREREYQEALDSQRRVQGRIQHLRKLLAGLAAIEPDALLPGRVGFGSVVRVRDLQTGEEFTYTLMAGEPIDLEAGEISLASPVGHALLGRRPGDEIEVQTPQRVRRLRVLSMTSLLDSLPPEGALHADGGARSGAGR